MSLLVLPRDREPDLGRLAAFATVVGAPARSDVAAVAADRDANVGVVGESSVALVPGETSLIVAGALAALGRLSLPVVIAVAASASP